LDTPVDETKDEELFTNFLSAPPAAVAQNTPSSTNVMAQQQGARTEEEESFFNQPTSAVQQASAKMTTDSILALYAKAPPQQPYTANGELKMAKPDFKTLLLVQIRPMGAQISSYEQLAPRFCSDGLNGLFLCCLSVWAESRLQEFY
jgi:hypothetical protein